MYESIPCPYLHDTNTTTLQSTTSTTPPPNCILEMGLLLLLLLYLLSSVLLPLRSSSFDSYNHHPLYPLSLIKVLHALEPKLVDAIAEHDQFRGRVQGHFGGQHSLLILLQGRHYRRRHINVLLHSLQNPPVPETTTTKNSEITVKLYSPNLHIIRVTNQKPSSPAVLVKGQHVTLVLNARHTVVILVLGRKHLLATVRLLSALLGVLWPVVPQ